MENNSILLEKIEECRNEMVVLSIQYGLCSEAVIKSSQKLDQLLNAYEKYKCSA